MTDMTAEQQWAKMDALIAEYVDGYEFIADDFGYAPNEKERTLIVDAIHGILADEDFTTALRQALSAPRVIKPVDVLLGKGDKMVSDIYDHDGEWAGVGIFHGGSGVGVRMSEHDGKNIEDLDAICLIRSTSVESLMVLAQECNEAIARMQGAAATKEASHD